MDNIKVDRHQLGVVFEMEPDLISYDRKVYTLVEWFSDIGGLASSCIVSLKIVMLLIKYRDVEWYIVSRLFTAKELLTGLSSDSDMYSQDSALDIDD